MRLLVTPRAQPPLGPMLLLTLLLGAVCGVPVKEPPSPRVLLRNPPMTGAVDTGEDQQPEGPARPAPTPVAHSSLNIEGTFRPPFLDGHEGSPLLGAGKALSVAALRDMFVAKLRDLGHGSHTHEEDGAEAESGMRFAELQGPVPEVRVIHGNSEGDRCDSWLRSSNHSFIQYLLVTLADLPSCPCRHPEEALGGGVATVFDARLNHTFSWKDASEVEEHVLFYHPSAHRCLRSLRQEGSRTLSSQLCCYNRRGRLLTRGDSAGSPEFVSPYVSSDMHFTMNRYPRVFCKGDWRRYHRMLPPNNGLACPQRPSKEKYEAQLLELLEN